MRPGRGSEEDAIPRMARKRSGHKVSAKNRIQKRVSLVPDIAESQQRKLQQSQGTELGRWAFPDAWLNTSSAGNG